MAHKTEGIHSDVPIIETSLREAGRYSAMGEIVDEFGSIEEVHEGVALPVRVREAARTAAGTENGAKAASAHNEKAADDQKLSFNPATFRLVCESRDKRLCLFEDAEGHLTLVRSARLV